jgi:hypothetical protein
MKDVITSCPDQVINATLPLSSYIRAPNWKRKHIFKGGRSGMRLRSEINMYEAYIFELKLPPRSLIAQPGPSWGSTGRRRQSCSASFYSPRRAR